MRTPLWAIVLLGLLLLVPMLAMPFYADDCLHQLVLRGDEPSPLKPWALYDFGEREDWQAFDGNVGSFPWWTGTDWKARFLRPVSSLYLAGLHALFGEHPLPYHVVGLALFAVLLVAAHGLYLRLGLSEDAARLATLLLAVSDAGALPAGWPANHNSLLVALLAVLSLRTLLAPRIGTARILGGLALAACATLAKEAGVVALFLAGCVLTARARGTAGSEERRLRLGGAAAGLGLAAYLGFLVTAGYGTVSLFYATPWADPARAFGNLAVLATGGLASLAGPFPLDVAMLAPQALVAVAAAGAVLGLPLAVWVARTVRGAPGTGWLALWTLGFLAVQAGAPPADRLLFVPSIGAAALLAIFFERRRRLAAEGRTGRFGRGAARTAFVAATFGSGAFLVLQGFGLASAARYTLATALTTDVGPRELGHRTLFVLQPESQMQAFTLHTAWALESDDHDVTFWNLQAGRRTLRWSRVDERTFDLETLDAPFLSQTFERVYLSETPAFRPGDRWRTTAFEVEALAVTDGHPTRLRFRLETSLDEPTVRFLRSVDGTLSAITPPAVGESTVLEIPERGGPFMP